jgi:competence protein ComEC
MTESLKKYKLILFGLFVLFLVIFFIHIDYKNSHRKLMFAMLDIGQGDSFFIESPSGIQVLVDTGPSKKVLTQLQKVMSPFDRTIDVLILTHPDSDHVGGALDILKNYKISLVFESGGTSDSKIYQNIEQSIKQQKIPDILARSGMQIQLGSDTYLDFLYPNKDVSEIDTNDGSIVARLSYGVHSFLLTGDAPIKTENILIKKYAEKLKSEFLKVGHHGSKTASSFDFLHLVNPKYALISVGIDNRYGHPNNETVDRILQFTKNILRTDLSGQIIINCVKMEPCEIKK